MPVQRAWRGRGEVTVLATGYGDPRLAPGTDDEQAMALAQSLADGGARRFVAASGVPEGTEVAGGDVARRLEGVEVVDGGRESFDAVMAVAKVAWGLGPPANQAFRIRRLSLAAHGDPALAGPVAQYRSLCADAIRRIDDARGALAREALLRTETLPRRAVVVCPAIAAEVLCATLEGAGRGGRLVTTEEGALLMDAQELFWTGMEAGLPSPGGPGLIPWSRSLLSFHQALTRWPGRAAFLEQVESVSEDTPPLTGSLAAHVEEALALLVSKDLAPWPDDLPLHLGSNENLAMAYDSFTHRLKVAPVVEQLPVELTAAVLLHELVHVHDVALAAMELDTDHRGLALCIDRLPPGVRLGMMCCMEDLAYRKELESLPALGIELPPADAIVGHDPESRLLRMLATLRDAGPGSTAWLSLVDSFVLQGWVEEEE